MAGETPIAKLVAELGFNIKVSDLNKFSKLLKNTETSLEKLQAKFSTTFSGLDRNISKQQNAQKRDLDISIKKLKLEQESAKLKKLNDQVNQRSKALEAKYFKDQAKVDEAKAKSSIATEKAKAAFLSNLQKIKLDALNLEASAKLKNLEIDRQALKVAQEAARLAAIKAQTESRSLHEQARAAALTSRAQSYASRVQSLNATSAARTAQIEARTAAGFTPRGGRGGGGGATAAFGGGLMGWTLLSGSHLQAAAGGFGVGYGLSQVNTLVNDISSLSLSLRSITGSAEDASKALDYLKAESLRVGFDYFGAAQGYKNILAATAKTPLGARGGQQIFTGFMEYSTAYGSTEEQKQRGLNAIQQMLSKKRIYAEELTQQLSESIPGATQIFADVLAGGDTAKLRKMMEKGEGVNALEAIPKVVAAMREQVKLSGTLEARQKSLTHAQNLFRFSWISLVELLAKSGFEAGQARIFKSMSKELENSRKQIEEIGKAWANKVAPVVSNVIGYIGDILRGLWDNKEAVFGIIAALNPWKTALIGILAIVEDLWLYFTDKDAITVTGELTKKFETLRDVLQTIKNIFGFLKESAYGINLDPAIKENIKGKNPAIYMTAEQIARAKASEYARGIESGAGVFGGSGSIQRTPEYRYTSPIAQKPMSPLKLEATIDLNMPDGSTQSITQMFDLTEQMSYTSGITIPYR